MIHSIPEEDIFPHDESLDCDCNPQLTHESGEVIAEHRTFSGMHLLWNYKSLTPQGRISVCEQFIANLEAMYSSKKINSVTKKKLTRDLLKEIIYAA